MFNKKVLGLLAFIVGVLLVVKAIFVLTMFTWSFYGQAPVMIFNPGASMMVNVLLLVQELGTLAFFFLVVGFIKSLVCWCPCDMPKPGHLMKAASDVVHKATSDVVHKAKRTVRKVAKKK